MARAPVFADANYFVALADPKDRWHAAAAELASWLEARAPVHTTALAVAEIVALVGARHGGKVVQQAYDAIRDDAVVHFPDGDDLDASMAIVLRYDGALSLSDAYLLHAMQGAEARQLVSFDADFDGKGVDRVTSLRKR